MTSGEPVVRPGTKIIPMRVGPAVSVPERREQLRAAVRQAVRHLVIQAVPVPSRSPYYEHARGLLDEAGWGLDELVEAAEPGPAQQALFAAIGLTDG
ncbi:MAG TPA: hypothetical protein VNW94_24800 [Streptosporangiaceae bacterium]|jgi:hypothetical protein|nr:hypothetical protein [Streptosporangiaceae bacterium]